ncbi:hypothetical protein BPTFM16_00244 [Altererythrobacter insulae]|nr:hypothetical protein BPTFM16_00244 [Altererythrobacter insulae]
MPDHGKITVSTSRSELTDAPPYKAARQYLCCEWGKSAMKLAAKIADTVAAAVISLGGPLFRAVGRNPGGFPRYLRQADRSEVHLRSTHYYHPTYRDCDLPEDVSAERDLPGLELHPEEQLAMLDEFAMYQSELADIAAGAKDANEFVHGNGAYEYADAESLYAMLRHSRPARVIEVGSGHSTRIAKTALDANTAKSHEPPSKHICIEPYEMDWLENLGVETVRSRVQDIDRALFDELSSGDVLFIDSSHVIRPFGDVLFLFQQVIPRLSKGVLVHVHDIFTPRDYPESWLRNQRRLWNEQYLMETLLAHSTRYRVRLALNWLANNYGPRMASVFPAAKERPGHQPGAFWFEVME